MISIHEYISIHLYIDVCEYIYVYNHDINASAKSIGIQIHVLHPHMMHVVQYQEMISSVNIYGPSRQTYGYMCYIHT